MKIQLADLMKKEGTTPVFLSFCSRGEPLATVARRLATHPKFKDAHWTPESLKKLRKRFGVPATKGGCRRGCNFTPFRRQVSQISV